MANKSKGHGLQGFNRKINAGHPFGLISGREAGRASRENKKRDDFQL